MQKISKKVVFFGNERLATGVTTTAPALTSLIEHGYEVVAIAANYERGKSRNSRDLEIAKVASTYGIPLLLPEKLRDIHDQLQGLQPAVGILVSYGKIVPQTIIDLFPHGIINIHPSLLPKHRGPTPLESVILDGSSVTGVSLMQLVKGMDAGPIYAQSEIALQGDESKQYLASTLLEIGRAMLVELLPDILRGTVIAKPQDEQHATYDNLIDKRDGIINSQLPAELLERQVRAYAEWPKSRLTIADQEVIISDAHVLAGNDPKKQAGEITAVPDRNSLMLECGKGRLRLERLKPAGKRDMSAKEFLAGYGKKL
jgi:methionyl-tRNA formyltransferase